MKKEKDVFDRIMELPVLRIFNPSSLFSFAMQKICLSCEYYGAAEPPVRCGESHLSGLTEPPQFVY